MIQNTDLLKKKFIESNKILQKNIHNWKIIANSSFYKSGLIRSECLLLVE